MKTLIICFSIMAVIILSFQTGRGQSVTGTIHDKRITIKMDKRPLGEVFRYIMLKYDIVIGFEQSTFNRKQSDFDFKTNFTVNPSITSAKGYNVPEKQVPSDFTAERYPITIDVKGAKIKEVLDVIVPQMENYKWEINDDVVNIFPIKGRDVRFEQLMRMKIKRFVLAKGQTIEDITEEIRELPEFRSFIKQHNLEFFGYRSGMEVELSAEYGRQLNQGLSVSDVSFLELLNKVASLKRGGWLLKMMGNRGAADLERFDIDI